MNLYPHQDQHKQDLRNALRTCKRVVGVMPTGGGKSHIIASIIADAAIKNRRVYLFAHRKKLIKQLSGTLASFGISHDLILPGSPSPSHLVAVGSVDTVARRTDLLEPPNIIVIDEGHHLVKGNKWGRVVDAWPDAYLIGFTASPARLDGTGLGHNAGGYYEQLIVGPTAAWLTDNGYLPRVRIYAPPPKFDRRSIKKVRGDLDAKQVEIEVNRPSITGDAIDHYKRLVYPGTALASCTNIKHANDVAQAFNDAGISAASLTGDNDETEQLRIFDGLESGAIKVVSYCELISEGVNVPSVSAAILLRPTESLVLCLQQIGRLFRGKTEKIILDHVGNVQRHNLLTIGPNGITWREIEWSLEGKQKPKRDQAPSVRTCPECFAAIPSGTPECPACGHVFTAEERRELEQVAGELVEVAPKGWRPGDAVRVDTTKAPLINENNPRKVDATTLREVHYIAGPPKMGEWVQIVRDKYLATALSQGRVTEFKDAYWCKMSWLTPIANHKAPRPSAKGRTLEELQEIGRQLGYKPGWARRVYDGRMVRQQA